MTGVRTLFPYEPRPDQLELLDAFAISQEKKVPFVLEGPTGVGKTVCALSSTISLALAMDKRVLYLTRTNSQQTQVMREARAIKEFGGTEKKVTACGIQGRQRSCPLIKVDTDLQGGTPEELSKVCGRKKRLALENKPGGCPYYKGFRDMDRGEVFRWMSEKVPTPEAVAERLIPMGVCPYEASKEFMSEALVVSAPYVYFFNIGVRRAILESMRCSIPDLIVVVDEAHNLPEYARDLMSPKMGLFTVERAIAEVKKKGDPEVAPGIKASELCEAIGSAISGIAEEYCQEQDDALLPAVEFSVRLLSYLGTTSNKLETAVRGLLAMGEQMRQERLNRGKLPRSFAHSLALFMEEWNAVSEENYVHLALSSPVSIEAYCLDPTRATGELSNAAWSLHMSGTLRPLEEYRDSLGLEGGMLHISPSPFPPENRVVLCAEDVTTRYEEWRGNEENRQRMERYLEALGTTGKNTLVFFPSFALLNECLETGAFQDVHGPMLFVEDRKKEQRALMEDLARFRKEGGVFLSVMGGRLSEGIDLPGDVLEVVAIAGMPYPKPSARQQTLIRHYDRMFDRGWEYAVNAPMERKTLQAIGRLIRTENDRGVVIFLDHRGRRLANLFHTWEEFTGSDALISRVSSFFGEKD